MNVRKNHTCRNKIMWLYSHFYYMAHAPSNDKKLRAEYQEKADKITEDARRVNRLARIMRDPFYLSAERASEWM